VVQGSFSNFGFTQQNINDEASFILDHVLSKVISPLVQVFVMHHRNQWKDTAKQSNATQVHEG